LSLSDFFIFKTVFQIRFVVCKFYEFFPELSVLSVFVRVSNFFWNKFVVDR